MKEVTIKLKHLLNEVEGLVSVSTADAFAYKPSTERWSKKEILGHLIDSGINNLQRFTEIQYQPRPYSIRKYAQDALVKANDYQDADIKALLTLGISLNQRILSVIDRQTEDTLRYTVLVDEEQFDLAFLIKDYVDHTEHHINQLK